MDCWKKLCPTHIYPLDSTTTQCDGKSTNTNITHYKLDHTNKEGDFAVAIHNIPEGTLILQEYPYVFQVLDRHSSQICPGCLSSMADITSPTHCRQSSCSWKLAYCSPHCESRHWFSIHMYVCPFYANFGNSQHLLLAFQMWIQFITTQTTSATSISAKGNQVNNTTPSTSSNNSNNSNNNNTLCLETLADNLHQHSENDIERYKLDAIDLSQLFVFSIYDTKDIQKRLVRYQAMIRCNGFGNQRRITAHLNNNSIDMSTMDVTLDTVATSIYPLASKFNHSCQPNVLALFLGTQLQLRATRPILSGHPLCISYGPLAANSPFSKRQENLLERYFFECHCQACQVVSDTSLPPSIDQIYLCPHCQYNKVFRLAPTCPECKNEIDWNNIQNL